MKDLLGDLQQPLYNNGLLFNWEIELLKGE